MPSTTSSHSNGGNAVASAPSTEKMRSQWLFTPAELLKSPSILEGMPSSQELANRQKGVNFITQVGIMLKLPQLTLATASVFLHRFYMRHSMQISKDKGIHHYSVAATALFLATKVEENCRKMRELIVACCRVAQKQPNLVVDEQSKEYWRWRDTILHNEDVLLEALCFDLQLDQPYRILFDFLCYYGVQENKNLRNTSWAFLNDSHITTLCLLFPPRIIAGSAIYAGAKMTGVTLPDDDQGRPWWQNLELDIGDVQKTCNVMAEVYENPALPRQGQKEAYLREDDILSFDRTRRTQSPSVDRSPAYSQTSASQGVKRDREESWGHEQRPSQRDATAPSQDSVGGQIPSPKRQRTDSQSNGDHARTTRVPSTTGSRIPQLDGSTVDDMRRRSDDTLRGSITTSDNRPYGGARKPHQDTSHAHRSRDVATHRNNQTSTMNGTDSQRSRLHDDRPNERHETQHQDIQPEYSRSRALSDHAEEVDYGSEEGEV